MIDWNKNCPIYFKKKIDEERSITTAYYKIDKVVNNRCYGIAAYNEHIRKNIDWYSINSILDWETDEFTPGVTCDFIECSEHEFNGFLNVVKKGLKI